MTLSLGAPPQVPTYLTDLMKAFDLLRALVGVADEIGGQSRAESRFTVRVKSEAEVDAAAAALEVKAGRPCCGRYQAVRREGPVTAVVMCDGPGAVPPAGAAEIDAVLRMASGEAGRGAA